MGSTSRISKEDFWKLIRMALVGINSILIHSIDKRNQKSAIRNRNEDKLKQLRIAAENGGKKAMCEYGKELAYNDKYRVAFKWLKKSEDLNDTDALKALGKCYLHKKSTDKNIKKAINCFLRVVELGDSIGANYIYNISLEYDECIDFYEVVRIFEQLNNNLSTKKADANSINSYSLLRFMLACCYYWGVGTEQNKEHAKQLLLSVGYDFDKDNAPLLIKEITLAEPFPNIKPICKEFFIPLQKNFFWIDTKKLFDKRYSFLSKFNLSKYSKTKELFDFLQKDGVDPWLYLHTAKEKPANEMFDALVDNNYPAFRDACINEPYFAGSILLYNQLKTKYQHLRLSTYLLLYKTDNPIHSVNLSKTQFIFACILIQSIIKESNIASNLTDSEDEKYKELTKILNQPEFSDKIYEFKDCCRNNPSIFKDFEFTKEELSSIFGIVDESPDDIDEAPLSVPPSSNENSLSLTKTPTNIITKEDMNAFCVAFASHCIPNDPEAIKFFFWSTGKPVCSTIQWRSTIRLFVAFLHYAYKGLDLPFDTENMVKKIFFSKKGKPITIAGYGIDKYEDLLRTVEIEIKQVK